MSILWIEETWISMPRPKLPAQENFRPLVTILFLLVSVSLWAATGGSVSGVVADPTGAVVPGAQLTLVNIAQGATYQSASDQRGVYSFPNLPVGHYDLIVGAAGFKPQRQTNLVLDTDSVLKVNVTLTVGEFSDTVTVNAASGVSIDTASTHLGEIVSSAQIASMPLNGRSYTDLLAIQPGVTPASTLLPSSVIMAGVTGTINPSGDQNPGNLSINGQRESSNGFLVNGIDVQEHMNGGTSIIPDLDSIDEFRVLSSNFDPEYGNYNGGIITVISKSGADQFHGGAFEFFRDTALDARGYFDPTRSAFNQNQFGGELGGPLRRDHLFFFGDYQGTRTTQGLSTGNISVPTLAERGGNFSADAAAFTATATSPSGQTVTVPTTVSGPNLASILSTGLGYAVSAGEPYYYMQSDVNPNTFQPYGSNCTSTSQCVLPTLTIPQSAWSAPGKNLLRYIPSPNVGASQFSTSAYSKTVQDNKGSFRMDSNSRLGQMSGYYFLDSYTLDDPYPGEVAGASIPGFDALTIGRAQLYSLGDIKVTDPDTVNELHLGYLRNANIIGQPKGGLGVSMAAQGFSSGPDGIYVQGPQFEGVENITFPTFVMGVPITNTTQVNNTFYVSDAITRIIGEHTLKLGGQFHVDQVNNNPNATFNGTFNINGTETGDPYADFLIGVPSNFTQSSGEKFYLRNRYIGLFGQDSWRARSDLTLNLGLRWDVIMPWWEKYNSIQTYIAGKSSVLYPGGPVGMVVPGDPGIPKAIAPTSDTDFAPRVGFAYTPRFSSPILKAIFGRGGQTSIRASYGIFYTAFPGLNAGIMYAVPPFGYNYLSPAPPLFATPFITAATGYDNGQRFPFPFPSRNVSAAKPDTTVNWANFMPISADPFMDSTDRVPYSGNYMFSIQRQITGHSVLTVSYVGNQGHHILTLKSANPGNPALCLSLPGCGPFGEDSNYVSSSGQTVYGTRVGQSASGAPLITAGENYGENTSDSSIANSNYNALETTLRYQSGGSQLMLSYTYAKSIDQGSNLGEQFNFVNPRQGRTISAWDMKHDFVGSYTAALPIALLARRNNRLTNNWTLSGSTRFTTGFPVTLFDNSDNSLLGTLGNGANNYLLDTPQYTPGPLNINTNGRNGSPAFDKSLFSEENPGQLGNARRRIFYGPGIEDFDMTLAKSVKLREGNAMEFRMEAFNAFNHTQFYGPAAVDGQIEDPHFGNIVSAASPRLVQLAAKFSF
jgi:hypothetical protein